MIYFNGSSGIDEIRERTNIIEFSNAEKSSLRSGKSYEPYFYLYRHFSVYVGKIQVFPESPVVKLEVIDFSAIKNRYEYHEEKKKIFVYIKTHYDEKVDLTGLKIKAWFKDGTSKVLTVSRDELWEKDCGRAGMFANCDTDSASSPMPRVHYCWGEEYQRVVFRAYINFNEKGEKTSDENIINEASDKIGVVNISGTSKSHRHFCSCKIALNCGKLKYFLPFSFDFYFEATKNVDYSKFKEMEVSSLSISGVYVHDMRYWSGKQYKYYKLDYNISNNSSPVYVVAINCKKHISFDDFYVIFFSKSNFDLSYTTTTIDYDLTNEEVEESIDTEQDSSVLYVDPYDGTLSNRYDSFDFYYNPKYYLNGYSIRYATEDNKAHDEKVDMGGIPIVTWNYKEGEVNDWAAIIAYMIGSGKLKNW